MTYVLGSRTIVVVAVAIFCHRSFNKLRTKLQSVSLSYSLSLPQALHHHLSLICGTWQTHYTYGLRHEV